MYGQDTEKAMATHYSTLAWKIPWTEEPGRLQSMGSWSQTRLKWLSSSSSSSSMGRIMKDMLLAGKQKWKLSIYTSHGLCPSPTKVSFLFSITRLRAPPSGDFLQPHCHLFLFPLHSCIISVSSSLHSSPDSPGPWPSSSLWSPRRAGLHHPGSLWSRSDHMMLLLRNMVTFHAPLNKALCKICMKTASPPTHAPPCTASPSLSDFWNPWLAKDFPSDSALHSSLH